MASSSGKRTSSSNRTRKSTTNSRSRQAQRTAQDSELFHEIGLIVLFVVMVILFCCNFGIIGPVGNAISGVLFGIFGFTAYIAPIVIFLAVAFWFANEGNLVQTYIHALSLCGCLGSRIGTNVESDDDRVGRTC